MSSPIESFNSLLFDNLYPIDSSDYILIANTGIVRDALRKSVWFKKLGVFVGLHYSNTLNVLPSIHFIIIEEKNSTIITRALLRNELKSFKNLIQAFSDIRRAPLAMNLTWATPILDQIF